jgi:hypothetical protein
VPEELAEHEQVRRRRDREELGRGLQDAEEDGGEEAHPPRKLAQGAGIINAAIDLDPYPEPEPDDLDPDPELERQPDPARA